MSNLLPFANDVTLELFDEAQGLVVGFMFASMGTEPITQEQRWVLYREYQSPPALSVALRVPADPALQFNSLKRFLEALCSTNGPLWRTNAKYVKVVARTYDVFPTDDPAPLPFPNLKFGDELVQQASDHDRKHPKAEPFQGRRWPVGTGGIQIDNHPAILTSRSLAPIPDGYVFGTAIEDGPIPGVKQNLEYWVALPAYVAADTSASLFLRNDSNETHQSLSGFLDAMRRLEGANLTLASCAYAVEIPQNP
jgi:hypothetical protein